MGFLDSISKKLHPIQLQGQPEINEAVAASHTQTAVEPQPSNNEKDTIQAANDVDDGDVINKPVPRDVEAGIAEVEALQAVWGKHGFWIVIAGIGMIMVVYELDNTTTYIYGNYALSSFNRYSLGAALSTAGVILFAVVKPPIAKLSNIIGRGETYIFTISCYVLSYILFASAKNFGSYTAGYIFYVIGQSGTNIMNDIIISDITSAKWRGFAISASFFPYLFMPWISAFIVGSVVAPGGVGWRWGFGMLAIIMPICSSFIIGTLLIYSRKAKKAGLVLIPKEKMTVHEFCSQIDLGGTFLFTLGLALFLLPISLASSAPKGWQTPYIGAMMGIGLVLLIILPFYESRYAKFPLLPLEYFKNKAIVIAALLLATDQIAFALTHSYLYAWSTIARNLIARDATFLQYTNGVMQTLIGMVAGLYMAKTRRYKWLTMAAVILRLVGYGVMVRLRGAENPIAELFIVQLVQGAGSGILLITALISAQIHVPHNQMAQITALIICSMFIGSSIGSTIAGGIYTNTLKDELRKQLGAGAEQSFIDSLYNSITTGVPEWGTPERHAINYAYSDMLRYMTYSALAFTCPSIILAWFMPNKELPDQNNLVEG